MKTMNRLLIIGFVLFSGTLKAQEVFTPDEIWYSTGKNIYIQFSLPSIYDLNHFSNSSNIFSDLYSESAQGQIRSCNLPSGMSILMNKKEGEIIISEKMTTSSNYIPGDLIPDRGAILHELKVFNIGDIKINCYFKNMDDLLLFLKNDWSKSVRLITAEFQNLPSWSKKNGIHVHYRQNGDTIQNTFVGTNTTAEKSDQLVIRAESGINSFKGKLLPDFTVGIGLMFSIKGIIVNNYFLNYELMYDFVSENNQSVPKSNHFIDVGYARNFTKNPNKADWYGISLGYLIQKNSEIFDDHTLRLSIHRNISKHIVLVPQMYFPNNFSNVFPGLKVNISF